MDKRTAALSKMKLPSVVDSVQGDLAWLPQRAGVDEKRALHADAVGDEWEGETHLRGGGPEQLATEGIV